MRPLCTPDAGTRSFYRQGEPGLQFSGTRGHDRLMVSRIVQWTSDVQDAEAMSRFWSRELGYRVDRGDDGSAELYPPDDAAPEVLTIWLRAGAAPKRDKRRGHVDHVAADGEVEAEVDRLIGLGARRADVGQMGDEEFVVLADPEGNEFGVMYGRPGG